MTDAKKQLALEQKGQLLDLLQKRFESNKHRHKTIDWQDVQAALETNETKLQALYKMEETGGAPDVIGQERGKGAFLFVDCSRESPKGRRSLCYDRAAWISRKSHKPKNSAIDLASEMGISLLTEEDYRMLQELEAFDLKTSSWIITPEEVRKQGGAQFCDRRYGKVFLYHNGPESYYAARGFRGKLIV